MSTSVFDRLEAMTQDQHVAALEAARQRIAEKRARRRERAERAAARLRVDIEQY